MLTRVSISGFKAIREADDVALAPFSLFIGRNGSGKSSFLEALQWLQESLVKGVGAATAERFGSFDELVHRLSPGIWLDLSMDHGSRHVRYELWVERGIVAWERCREGPEGEGRATLSTRKGSRGPAVRSIAGANPVRDGDTLALAQVAKTEARGAERLFGFLRNAVFLRLSPAALARRDTPLVRGRSGILAEDGSNLAALLARMSPEQRERIAGRVAEVIHGIEAIDVVEAGQRGYFQARERLTYKPRARRPAVTGGRAPPRRRQAVGPPPWSVHAIPAWLLSEGTRRIAAIFALLESSPPPSLIAVEEIENGLDPWTLQFVLRALREAASEGVQILLTTHSPYLLDQVEPDMVIYVSREDGEVTYTPADTYDDVKKYMGVVPTGAMYTSGYFTRKP
jgi:energy-coupling factor transporter ATP-binding protein EcfA2